MAESVRQVTARLMDAIDTSNVVALQASLAEGASPTASFYSPFVEMLVSPLELAACWNFPEAVHFLVDAGADPNDNEGEALWLAVQLCDTSDDLEMVRVLVERGASILMHDEILLPLVKKDDGENARATPNPPFLLTKHSSRTQDSRPSSTS